jgi:hypothetical protein
MPVHSHFRKAHGDVVGAEDKRHLIAEVNPGDQRRLVRPHQNRPLKPNGGFPPNIAKMPKLLAGSASSGSSSGRLSAPTESVLVGMSCADDAHWPATSSHCSVAVSGLG